MKKTIKAVILFNFLLLLGFAPKVKAQSATAKQSDYKNFVGENPNAEADIKIVGDFINALTSQDTVKAKSLLADGYLGYGPAPTDSSTAAQTIAIWQENYKTQSDIKFTSVSETFRVLQGDLKGDWVAVWGEYSFKQNGKKVTFPLQYTARVANGKINTDRVYYDRLYIVRALGYKLTPPDK